MSKKTSQRWTDKDKAVLHFEWMNRPSGEKAADFDERISKRLGKTVRAVRAMREREGLHLHKRQRRRKQTRVTGRAAPKLEYKPRNEFPNVGTYLPPDELLSEPLLKLRYVALALSAVSAVSFALGFFMNY